MDMASREKVNLRKGADYLAGLDDGRRVFIGGEAIENVATHPLTRDYAQRIADYYDLHFDPELQDKLTFVEDGVRRSRMWQLPRTKAELVERREFHTTVSRKIGAGQFGRMPDTSSATLITLVDDPEPWEENSIGSEGRGLADNIRRFWAEAREDNRNTVPIFIDTQPDRSRDDAFKTSPDLRLVDTDEKGITVNGIKAVSTGAVTADWFQIGLFFRPGVTSEQCLYFFVKPNAPGLTIVARQGVAPAKKTADQPLSQLGDEWDSFQHFDNVKIPWSQVIHIGNVQHAQQYPQRIFDWLHYSDLARQTVKVELLAGLALLLCEVMGTLSIPAVQLRVADIIRFREAIRAHLLAAEDTGFITPGGLYKPNNLFFDFGRAFYNEHSPGFVQELIDLAGRGPMMIPDVGDWENPELKAWLEPMMRGPAGEDDKLKVFRVIRDLFLTDWGRRNGMFDQFNGTPLTTVRFLTMMRAEYQPDGPVTELAREVCGLGKIGAGQGEEAADYAKAQDAKTD
jgi:4-hydroxyphenylacetate 3-monooxygenase